MPERGGMACTSNDPEFLRTYRRFVNSFRMPAGNSVIGSPATKQHSERARGHGFFGRNVTRIKTALFLNGSQGQNRGGAQQRAAQLEQSTYFGY